MKIELIIKDIAAKKLIQNKYQVLQNRNGIHLDLKHKE